VLNCLGVRVHGKYFAAFAKQVNQISAISAPGVEHALALRDIPAQDLIEDVNIDLAELVLKSQRCASVFLFVAVANASRRSYGAAVDFVNRLPRISLRFIRGYFPSIPTG
jgi:hypothetical protein